MNKLQDIAKLLIIYAHLVQNLLMWKLQRLEVGCPDSTFWKTPREVSQNTPF